MEKEIGKIQKGEYQGTVTDIIIGIKEYNGRVGIDIREFTTSETYTGPTKKGLRVPAESFEKFKELINSIDPNDLKEAPKEIVKEQEILPEKEDKINQATSGIDSEGLM
jgi:hypothetical protein